MADPFIHAEALQGLDVKFLLTLDYELYGDGSGDVFEHMIRPTDRLLALCEGHGARMTIFLEVIEYLRLKQEWGSGNTMGYLQNPAAAIEEQLRGAVSRGHDVQLHVHPQWVNAKWVDGKWQVDLANWRLGDFQVAQSYSKEDLLRDGKQAIENIIRPVKPDYRCTILRAGGYNVMPCGDVYEAMVRVGLTIDSSIYPGGYESGELSRFDYRHAPAEKGCWSADPQDFARPSRNQSRVTEVPVFALKRRRFRKIGWQRLQAVFRNRSSAAAGIKAKTKGKSRQLGLKFFFEKEAFTWDFCLFSIRLHRSFLREAQRQHRAGRIHFVLIGHPKSFTGERSFVRFLKMARQAGVQFSTIEDSVVRA
ncbi:hypothetical protein OAN12_03570 [Halioglobus sp.]|nr:hypothetical protein [Halioglobus sp.]